MSDTEDYETIRQRNINKRKELLKGFLIEIEDNKKEIKNLETERQKLNPNERKLKENRTPGTPRSGTRKRRTRSPTFNGPRVNLEFRRKYNTRSRKRKLSNDGDSDNEENDLDVDGNIIVSKKSSEFKVMFPWSRPMQRDIDLMKYEFSEDEGSGESEEEVFLPKRKHVQRMSKSTYDPSTIPSPDEITQRMIDNIAQKASGKTYDAINGTSCHQCRQKTKDTKTVCRSGECIGVRGQFCGPCLMGRYGESAKEALKDPHWACPPCRDLCNCSICRTRNGQRPTGILAPYAKEEGYNSVKDYLEAKNCQD